MKKLLFLLLSAVFVLTACGRKGDPATEARLYGIWAYMDSYSETSYETSMALQLDSAGEGAILLRAYMGENATSSARIPMKWLATPEEIELRYDTAAIEINVEPWVMQQEGLTKADMHRVFTDSYRLINSVDDDDRLVLKIIELDPTILVTEEPDSAQTSWYRAG